MLEAGRFVLTDGLSLDVDGVTLRGAGNGRTVLDFTTPAGRRRGAAGHVRRCHLARFRGREPQGRRDQVQGRGQYRLSPRPRRMDRRAQGNQRCLRHLPGRKHRGADRRRSTVSGASDAGIYVGQSKDITVRDSIAEYNVAGIEIENSRNALVDTTSPPATPAASWCSTCRACR